MPDGSDGISMSHGECDPVSSCCKGTTCHELWRFVSTDVQHLCKATAWGSCALGTVVTAAVCLSDPEHGSRSLSIVAHAASKAVMHERYSWCLHAYRIQ